MKEVAVTNKANMLLDPTTWNLIREQSNILVKSGFLPQGINTPEKAIAIMIKGVELGIPPMQAFAHIYIINGKPGMSAELMLAMILRAFPNLSWHYEKRDDTACCIVVTRPGGKPEKFSFSIEDAKKAGLMNNPTWTKYPRAMLRSRCISEMARSVFPDLIMGCSYTPEELGATVSEDGLVIDVKQPALPDVKSGAEPISREEIQSIFRKINQKENADNVATEFREMLKSRYNLESTIGLTKEQYYDILDWVDNHESAEAQREEVPKNGTPQQA